MVDKVFINLNQEFESVDLRNKLSPVNHFGIDPLVLLKSSSDGQTSPQSMPNY